MIAGGKLTTYRVMARDAVDAAAHSLTTTGTAVRALDHPPGAAAGRRRLRDPHQPAGPAGPPRPGCTSPAIDHLLGRYGDLVDDLLALIEERPELAEPLDGAEDYLAAEVVYAVTHEGARHLDDVLTRRTRISIETFDRGVRSAPAAGAADGAPSSAGTTRGSPTRSTTTCAGSRPSGRARRS